MKILSSENPIEIFDRNTMLVSVQEQSNTTYPKTNHNKFVLAYNAECKNVKFSLSGTFCLSSSEELTLTLLGTSSKILIIENLGFSSLEDKFCILTHTGQPGNLSYIDGCSNTNLIDPPRNGDPCLNYLYIPPNTDQTLHTHPSLRIGMILGGAGACTLTDNKEVPLIPGTNFILDRHEKHRFHTGKEALWLMVYHPDSEDGPRDENNPMKTRTYLK